MSHISNHDKHYGFYIEKELIKKTYDLFCNMIEKNNLYEKYSYKSNCEKFYPDNFEELYNKISIADYFEMYISSIDNYHLHFFWFKTGTQLSVSLEKRSDLLLLIEPFEELERKNIKSEIETQSQVLNNQVEMSKPKIFISHGRDDQWLTVKDILVDKYAFDVEYFEKGVTATKQNIYAVIEKIKKCNFGIIVHTGENIVTSPNGSIDENTDKTQEKPIEYHARDNVIHETGLCHIEYGVDRTLVLVEKDSYVYSNYEGIQQIRFEKGNIKAAICEIIPVIDREFPNRNK